MIQKRIFSTLTLAFIAATNLSAEPVFLDMTPISGEEPCNRCEGVPMPGQIIPSNETVYRIDSDLPELYFSNGLLYSTQAVLPSFLTNEEKEVGEDMLTQRNNGFETIDDSFEVFLYHLSKNHEPGEQRRIVVLATNNGEEAAVLNPRQSIYHGGNAGRPNSVESKLTRDVMSETWAIAYPEVQIEPGESAVISYTKLLGQGPETLDTTKEVFITGIVRSDAKTVSGGPVDLEIAVVSIPDSPADQEIMTELAVEWKETGANSGEEWMDETIPPPECHVRRVVGVSKNAIWQSEQIVVDVAKLPADGIDMPMATPIVQSQGCPEIRQTADMILHPGYVHPDTIGNFMMETHVTLGFTNSGTMPRTVIPAFGKDDARVGLGWQAAIGPRIYTLEELSTLPVQIGWAGKGARNVAEETPFLRPFLPDPITVAPGETTVLSIRCMVIGTSSLPYFISLRPDQWSEMYYTNEGLATSGG